MVVPGVSLAFPVRRDQQGAEVFGVSATTVCVVFRKKEYVSGGCAADGVAGEGKPAED